MLISFSGLPGAGKSTTAQELVRQLHAVYLSIDSVQKVTGDYPRAEFDQQWWLRHCVTRTSVAGVVAGFHD